MMKGMMNAERGGFAKKMACQKRHGYSKPGAPIGDKMPCGD